MALTIALIIMTGTTDIGITVTMIGIDDQDRSASLQVSRPVFRYDCAPVNGCKLRDCFAMSPSLTSAYRADRDKDLLVVADAATQIANPP